MSKTIRGMSMLSVLLVLLCGLTSGLFAQEAEVVTGCLEEGDEEGYFILVTEDDYEVYVTGPEELAKHLGHLVELTGAWVDGDDEGDSEADEGADEADYEDEAGSDEDDEVVFEVAEIEHVSADCDE